MLLIYHWYEFDFDLVDLLVWMVSDESLASSHEKNLTTFFNEGEGHLLEQTLVEAKCGCQVNSGVKVIVFKPQ